MWNLRERAFVGYCPDWADVVENGEVVEVEIGLGNQFLARFAVGVVEFDLEFPSFVFFLGDTFIDIEVGEEVLGEGVQFADDAIGVVFGGFDEAWIAAAIE